MSRPNSTTQAASPQDRQTCEGPRASTDVSFRLVERGHSASGEHLPTWANTVPYLPNRVWFGTCVALHSMDHGAYSVAVIVIDENETKRHLDHCSFGCESHCTSSGVVCGKPLWTCHVSTSGRPPTMYMIYSKTLRVGNCAL